MVFETKTKAYIINIYEICKICDFCNLLIIDGECKMCIKCEAMFCAKCGDTSIDEEECVCYDCED